MAIVAGVGQADGCEEEEEENDLRRIHG
jgi:hypothetical protein